MLAELPEIDAVVIATPDHSHAVITALAMELGKHVHCQKPLTHSVFEARRIGEIARRTGVATQMGNQGQAGESARLIAETIRSGIDAHLWSEEHGRYLRSRWVGRSDEGGDDPPSIFGRRLRYPTRAVRSVDREDARVDSSLLGLSWPFRAVEPGSPRMRATVAAVERELQLPDGGVLRHQDDDYAGGNPCLISTLWLGLAQRQAGDDAQLRRAIEYVLARQTSLGLLPEQVTRDGAPAWVVPLGWSHAMLILAARPELALVRDGA
jgi:GH15 family glucan-1,4-alpha-glucosidase